MMILILTILLAIFFAMNMGSASFAASFATAYGGSLISERRAKLLFMFFVVLGSLAFGQHVAITLGKNMVPAAILTQKAVVIIFFSAGLSMYVANLIKIPQSTSLVTVAAIAGVGVYAQQLNIQTLYYMIPFWLLLPVLSFGITYALASYIYPPRQTNFWIYERFIHHEQKLKFFVIAVSCYNAFSVGTNNVANVVGPLLENGSFSLQMLLFIFAIFYGLGSIIFPATLKAVSEDIVPLGLLTASIISFVSGSLMLIASFYGIPQSFVMLQMGAIFAISSLKSSKTLTLQHPITKSTVYTWTINPLITFGISYLLSILVLGS